MSDHLPTIHGIPVQINQLFGNLLANALKFARKDVIPRLTITCTVVMGNLVKQIRDIKDDETYYRISFQDNGIGFSQFYADQIFDIFQRLHPKAHFEGTGIGLAMCKKIVQNHNGEIYAESREGEGATFYVFLPARHAE